MDHRSGRHYFLRREEKTEPTSRSATQGSGEQSELGCGSVFRQKKVDGSSREGKRKKAFRTSLPIEGRVKRS